MAVSGQFQRERELIIMVFYEGFVQAFELFKI